MTRSLLVFLLYACSLSAHAALDAAQVRRLAAEDSSDKVAAIQQLTQTADPDAVRVLKAMAEDTLYLAGDKVFIVDGDKAFDAATGSAIKTPDNPESVTVNNRIRGELVSFNSGESTHLRTFLLGRNRTLIRGANILIPRA